LLPPVGTAVDSTVSAFGAGGIRKKPSGAGGTYQLEAAVPFRNAPPYYGNLLDLSPAFKAWGEMSAATRTPEEAANLNLLAITDFAKELKAKEARAKERGVDLPAGPIEAGREPAITPDEIPLPAEAPAKRLISPEAQAAKLRGVLGEPPGRLGRAMIPVQRVGERIRDVVGSTMDVLADPRMRLSEALAKGISGEELTVQDVAGLLPEQINAIQSTLATLRLLPAQEARLQADTIQSLAMAGWYSTGRTRAGDRAGTTWKDMVGPNGEKRWVLFDDATGRMIRDVGEAYVSPVVEEPRRPSAADYKMVEGSILRAVWPAIKQRMEAISPGFTLQDLLTIKEITPAEQVQRLPIEIRGEILGLISEAHERLDRGESISQVEAELVPRARRLEMVEEAYRNEFMKALQIKEEKAR